MSGQEEAGMRGFEGALSPRARSLKPLILKDSREAFLY
jgi:hypothetical protein